MPCYMRSVMSENSEQASVPAFKFVIDSNGALTCQWREVRE